jgi:uncharacterized metal-binding protein
MITNGCGPKEGVVLLACSGGSNVGQLSNRAAVELTQEGFGKMSCLAGIGGRLDAFIKSAKAGSLIAAIDGCAVGCAKAILTNAGIEKFNHIVLTDHGIEKNKNLNLTHGDVAKVKDAVRSACGDDTTSQSPQTLNASGKGCCG